ncbi:MAG TPA: YncE family protein [Mycobacterium sp.]|nr:YncE family protein [Mycobacterium sp.]HTX94639.1 YncE family protein [Mycobacterium sp.]
MSVIKTAQSKVTATIPVGDTPLGVAIRPDGEAAFVANLNSDSVSVVALLFNTVAATIAASGNLAHPANIAVGPANTAAAGQFYVTGDSGVVGIDGVSHQVSLSAPGSRPAAIAVSPDGIHLYWVSIIENTLSSANIKTQKVATVAEGQRPCGVAVSPDSARVYVANEANNSISVIDTATNAVAANIPTGTYAPVCLAVSPDGSVLYATKTDGGISDGTVLAIDTGSNTVITTLAVGKRPFGVTVSPDGGRLYVVNSNDSTVSVISV